MSTKTKKKVRCNRALRRGCRTDYCDHHAPHYPCKVSEEDAICTKPGKCFEKNCQVRCVQK